MILINISLLPHLPMPVLQSEIETVNSFQIGLAKMSGAGVESAVK